MAEGTVGSIYVTASNGGARVASLVSAVNASYLPGQLLSTDPTIKWYSFNDFTTFSFTGTGYQIEVNGVGVVETTPGMKFRKSSGVWTRADALSVGDDVECLYVLSSGETIGYRNIDSITTVSRTALTRYEPSNTNAYLVKQLNSDKAVLVKK